MKAMIFAAGLGTRLRPLTDDRPKALVSVAGAPLLAHTIRNLQSFGFDNFVVNAHHFASRIVEYLHSENNFGSHIEVSVEKDQPLETGGGIRKAEPLLKGDGKFFVHNVDIISNLDVNRMIASAPADALSTLLVSERKTSRYFLFNDEMRLVGWTNVDTGEVKSAFEDLDVNSCRKLAFGGVHVMSDGVFPLMKDWPEKFSIVDFYLQMSKDYPVYGYMQEDLKLIDVGKLSTLREAEDYLLSR